MNEIIKLNRNIKKFTRDGRKDPKDLMASDWELSTSYGYADSYAYVSSESLNLTLSYFKNKFPLISFMNDHVLNGSIELCRDNDKKARISIDNSFELVFTEDGFITSEEYYESLDMIDIFSQREALSAMDMTVGNAYLTIEGKSFIYLGFETSPSGNISKKPKIQEIEYLYKWDNKFTPNYLTIKKAKSIGNLIVVKELELSDMEMNKWKGHHFKELLKYASKKCDNIS